MRDLGFSRLRAAVEDAVDDAAPRPPFAEVVARAARVRRRRAGIGALAVTTVAAAALALTQPVRDTTGPTPVPTPTPGPAFEVSDVTFTSPRSGYAVLGPCAAEMSCTTVRGLARTDDGGRTWHRVTLPESGIGRDGFLLATAGGGQVSVLVGDQRYVSGDGGSVWRPEAALRDGPRTESVPIGQSVTVYCPVGRVRCDGRLAALDDVNGVQRPLVHQPALPEDVVRDGVGLTVTKAYQLWTVGRATNGELGLAYSDDRGVTWHDIRGPERRDWSRPELLTDEVTSRVYLLDWDTHAGHLAGVWRLDGWTGTWSAVTPRRLPDPVTQAQILPNGELRYTDTAGHPWHTRNAGTGLVRAPTARVDGVDVDVTLLQVVDGVLLGTPALGRRADRLLVSADDGQHWQVRPVRF